MKNIDLLLFATILFICWSCKEDPIPADKEIPTNSKGTATIIGNRQVEMGIERYRLRNRFVDQKIIPNKKGFKVDVELEDPSIVELFLNPNTKIPLFVAPGDTLVIDYDEINIRNNSSDFNVVSGHVIENKLLAEIGYIFKHIPRNENHFFNVSEAEFLEKLDALELLANQKIEEYKVARDELNPTNLGYVKHFIRVMRAQYLYYYPSCIRNTFAIRDYQESTFYQELKANAIRADDQLINYIAYLDLTSEILRQEFSKDNSLFALREEGRLNMVLDIELSLIDSLFAQKELRDYLKFNSIGKSFQRLQSYSPQDVEDFEKTNPPLVYIEELKKSESKLLGIFQENFILPNYQFKDINETVLGLDDFRGKFVYIDVWATWCGPCKVEGAYFQQLIEDFSKHEEGIVFMGISIDKKKDTDKWKREVIEKGLKGIQVIADRHSELSFENDFKVYEIPRFILIDKEGKVIESYALSPSQPEMKPYLEKLLTVK